MNIQRTIAYVIGGAAVGGAVVFGVSLLARSGSDVAPKRRTKARDVLVRVTENGRKYHRDTCPLLHGETRVINVTEALQSYEPCKACHPPGDVDVADLDASDSVTDSSRSDLDKSGEESSPDSTAEASGSPLESAVLLAK